MLLLTTLSSSDACEWENLLNIFHPDAYIYTTWTGRTHHLDFIAASKKGMNAGAFIMHRCHGISTDIDPIGTRAVTKMKATITQRFDLDGIEADAESDCRFCFFWIKVGHEWKARFVRHWYEKVSQTRSDSSACLLTLSIGQADPGESEQGASAGRGSAAEISVWLPVPSLLSGKDHGGESIARSAGS